MCRSELARRCASCGAFVEDPAASRTGACLYDLVMIGGRYYYRSVESEVDGCGNWYPERRSDRPEPEIGCRFCGAPYDCIVVRSVPDGKHWCECSVCGACGPVGGDRAEAVGLWEGAVDPFSAPCDEPATRSTLSYGFNLMSEGVGDES